MIILMILSVLLQFTAAYLSIRMVRITGKHRAWMLIAAAITLAALRRSNELSKLIFANTGNPPNATGELFSFLTSLCMVLGVAYIAPLFMSIKRSEECLRKSRTKMITMVTNMRDLYNNAPCGYHSLDQDGVFVLVNDTELHWLGYSREDLIKKKKLSDLMTPESAETFNEIFPVLKERGWIRDIEYDMVRNDGTVFQVLMNATTLRDENGNYIMSRGTMHDITERRKAEKELLKVNRALKTLSECNRAMIETKEEEKLLQDICRIIVEHGYCLAWVGYAEQDEARTVRAVAHAGYEEGYTQELNITWADAELGRGPVGKAIRSGSISISNDVAKDSDLAPWWNAALKRGYASIIGLPLKSDSTVFGALAIYASEPNAFTGEEVTLLKELADDLAYGVATVRSRIKRMEAEKVLEKLKHQNKLILHSAGEGICGLDLDGNIIFANPAAESMTGWEVGELIGKYQHGIMHHRKPDKTPYPLEKSYIYAACEEGGVYHVDDEVFWRKDGSSFPVEYTSTPIRDEQGGTTGAVMVFRDITIRKKTEKKMKQLSTAVEQTSDWILIADNTGTIEYVNDTVERITGYKREDILGKTPRILKSGRHDETFYKNMWDTLLSGQIYTGILTNRRKDGGTFEIFHTITPIKDNAGRITHFVATSKDITALKQMEERIDFLVSHSDLTGLPNRSLFADRLNQATVRAEYDKKLTGVLFIDIDRFQLINDALGANIGDALLKEIGERLSGAVREGDTVAHFGSDEFGVALIDLAKSKDIILVLEDIREALSRPFNTDGEEVIVTFSIGISIHPEDAADINTLIQNAAIACQKIKELGGNSYQFFTADMNIKASEFLLTEKNLFSAIKNNEFILHYQPYWDNRTRKMAGMEALIRWQSNDQGLVPPGKFIPVLEETGMIIEVGEWVLKTAIRQVKEWQDKGYPVVPVSVNLSLIQFRQRNLADNIKAMLKEFRLAPSLLTAEITESAFMEDIEFTREILTKLRDIGISISIDDFGTGYSSLSYLKKLRVDNLKIDISFVRELGKDPDAEAIVSAIITMAKALNLKTIAEGVETEEQWNILRLLQSDVTQGYYFSRPLPAEDMAKLLVESEDCLRTLNMG